MSNSTDIVASWLGDDMDSEEEDVKIPQSRPSGLGLGAVEKKTSERTTIMAKRLKRKLTQNSATKDTPSQPAKNDQEPEEEGRSALSKRKRKGAKKKTFQDLQAEILAVNPSKQKRKKAGGVDSAETEQPVGKKRKRCYGKRTRSKRKNFKRDNRPPEQRPGGAQYNGTTNARRVTFDDNGTASDGKHAGKPVANSKVAIQSNPPTDSTAPAKTTKKKAKQIITTSTNTATAIPAAAEVADGAKKKKKKKKKNNTNKSNTN